MPDILQLLGLIAAITSVIGATYYGIKRLFQDVAKITSYIIEIRELSRQNRVTLDVLQIVDDEFKTKIETVAKTCDNELFILKNRVNDLEQFLEQQHGLFTHDYVSRRWSDSDDK